MAYITCQFVRPDRLLYEGKVASVILVTPSGELGIWPLHSPEIVSLGDGIVRAIALGSTDGLKRNLLATNTGPVNVIVSGGYAEVENDLVIILADHARRSDDIEPEVVRATRAEAVANRESLDPDDHRRAYYDNKVRWCDLLLRHAEEGK